MNEYRNLVHTAHRHLQLELSSGRTAPSLKVDDSQLFEEELNILMVHAHWKVFRELPRQQVSSTRLLEDALNEFNP